MSDVMTGLITSETRGPVLLLGLNRPEKRNAFTLAMIQELSAGLAMLETTPDLRCAVIFAHGAHFTGGLDLMDALPSLQEGGSGLVDPAAVDPWMTHGTDRTKPVVVAVQGACLTLGIELVLACDICVAASDARFAQIEIARGIFPFGGGTARWVQAVGWGNAMRYLLTGDEFDAAEAYRLGIVQEIVDPSALLDRAIALAERISAQSPLGVQATLRSARLAVREGERAAAAALLPEIQRLSLTRDAEEGFMSFLERRPPQFEGH